MAVIQGKGTNVVELHVSLQQLDGYVQKSSSYTQRLAVETRIRTRFYTALYESLEKSVTKS